MSQFTLLFSEEKGAGILREGDKIYLINPTGKNLKIAHGDKENSVNLVVTHECLLIQGADRHEYFPNEFEKEEEVKVKPRF